ncbi:unnamed protein product [Brassica oleracea]
MVKVFLKEFSDPVTSRGDSIVTEDKVVSFATGFKRETECFEGTVHLTGEEKSGGYWLGEKREVGSGGQGA